MEKENLIKENKKLIRQFRNIWKYKNPLNIVEVGTSIKMKIRENNTRIKQLEAFECHPIHMAGPVEIAKRIAK